MPPPLPRCSGWAHSSLKLPHPYQPSPKPLSCRPAHRPFRGLLGVHSRCGLHTRAVTKIATVIRRLQTFRHLHACPGCFRLERLPGGACTHWKAPPCHGARGKQTSGEVGPRDNNPGSHDPCLFLGLLWVTKGAASHVV